jgi:hypothetical protein
MFQKVTLSSIMALIDDLYIQIESQYLQDAPLHHPMNARTICSTHPKPTNQMKLTHDTTHQLRPISHNPDHRSGLYRLSTPAT